MAQKTITVTVCDVCDRPKDARQYIIQQGVRRRAVDICADDARAIEKAMEAGTTPTAARVAATPRKKPGPKPGTKKAVAKKSTTKKATRKVAKKAVKKASSRGVQPTTIADIEARKKADAPTA